jgi:Ca2+-binding EF-hand superfamily protein
MLRSTAVTAATAAAATTAIAMLYSLGLGKNGLAHMFEELAQSNVEGLSLALLRDLAMRVDFNVSAEKMRNVFHAIDKDQTGRIMYQEMFQVHIYIYTFMIINY